MARLAKGKAKWHRVTIKGRTGDLVLMGSGRYVQLSVWTTDKRDFAYFTGQKALRTLAYAILKGGTARR